MTAEDEAIESACGGGESEGCDLTGEEQTEEESEVEILQENEFEGKIVADAVASDLKKGKSCRLKTEGEKLSKVIRKTAKAKKTIQNVEEAELEGAKEKVKKNSKQDDLKSDMKEKQIKSKRDTRAQENVGKSQKKPNKKNANQPFKGNKKSANTKKSSKSDRKSSKKSHRNKKTSRKEL